ncbi:MAG TPA: N,N-dimethylformamidase beta subunit family domain-containing protein, partial [Gemmatimonadales bacterium]
MDAADTVEVTVAVENRRPDREPWVFETQPDPSQLALWAGPASAKVGDTLRLHLQLLAPPATVRLLRIGAYGGAGARRVAEIVIPDTIRQPACTPAFPGPVQCPWTTSGKIPLGPELTGGVYQLVAKDALGRQATYPLVVTSRRPHDLNIVVPQFTWQAYNTFGGSGFYVTDPSTNRPVPWVSFARPYVESGQAPGGTAEFATIAWLERRGVDVGYMSDEDLARGTAPLANKGYIFIGHSEYWSFQMYQRVQEWRDAGKHLAFLSANNAYWNTRYFPAATDSSATVLYCYKGAGDPLAGTPQEVTTRFRNAPLNLPENALYGIAFPLRLAPPPSTIDLVVTDEAAASPFTRDLLAIAGVRPGDSLGISTGSEGDDLLANGKT